MYLRQNKRVFFLLPSAAVGVDEHGYYFIEFAWLCFAVGLGVKGGA